MPNYSIQVKENRKIRGVNNSDLIHKLLPGGPYRCVSTTTGDRRRRTTVLVRGPLTCAPTRTPLSQEVTPLRTRVSSSPKGVFFLGPHTDLGR